MIQRSRIAPPSDLRALRQERNGRRPDRVAALFKHLAAAAALGAVVWALPDLAAHGLPGGALRGAASAVAAVAEAVRALAVLLYQAIPVP